MKDSQPIAHDGWRSRTYLTMIGFVVITITVATVALFKSGAQCTFEQWSGFVEVFGLGALAIGLGKAGFDKREQRLADGAK